MTRRVLVDNERVGRWVCERTGGSHDQNTIGIGLERDGELIAGVLFDNYLGGSICMHVASDGSKNWMTREFLFKVFHYPFKQLGVSVIIGLVDSTNAAALSFDQALGFVLEHSIPGAGRHGDLVILTMRPAQCRFLNSRRDMNGQVLGAAAT